MTEAIKNDIFDRIHHSINVINSLQNCRGTFVMDKEEIDEQVFEELTNFESFIKRFESFFLQVLMDDLNAISKAAVINTNNSEKAEELIENINRLMSSFSRMESDCIAKSESLISMASQFKDKLALIKKNMEFQVKSQEKYRRELNSAIIGLPHAN